MSVADALIPVINDLQDVFQTLSVDKQSINLPQIVVVGSQSTGKSSVLEAICHRDVLPRGTGIVTRCPLILQLHKTQENTKAEENDTEPQEWAVFSHKKDEKFYNYDDICDEIKAYTNVLTGGDKNITTQPINMKLYSPNVIPLTLVDLPGLIQSTGNDQDKTLPDQIRKCVEQYIKNKNAIILAVCAANTDLANAGALQAAKEVDPNGERTIGVLTKVDLVDEGAENDVVQIVKNEGTHRLKLGWVAVRNRSQKDVNNKKSIEEHLKDEDAYFKNHEQYKALSESSGITILSQKLNQILIQHIQQKLPDLKIKIEEMYEQWTIIYSRLGETPVNPKEKLELVLNYIQKFSQEYEKQIEGHHSCLSVNEQIAAAKIDYYFKHSLQNQLSMINIDDILYTEKLFTLVNNANALSSDMFSNSKVFESLIKNVIKELKRPTRIAINDIKDLLYQIVTQIAQKEIPIYKKLEKQITDITFSIIDKCADATEEFWINYLQIEEFVSTNDPLFQELYTNKIINNLESFETYKNQKFQMLRQNSTFQQAYDKQAQNNILQTIIIYNEYYEILHNQIYTKLIKTIGMLLINSTCSKLQNTLTSELHDIAKVNELLFEPPSILNKRKDAKNMLEALRRAKALLANVVSIRTVENLDILSHNE